MTEIKTISCHGTSYTEGGGFEWDVIQKTEHLHKFFNELPKTEFNYSWPGQLQNLVSSDVKVFNYGKSGYGNKKTYRDVHDIFSNSHISNKNHLFLIELSQLGRDEMFLRNINDYCVINYEFGSDDTDIFELKGTAIDYYRDSIEVSKYLKSKHEFFNEYIKLTKESKTIFKEIERNFDFFISFLEYNDLNYYFVNTPLVFFNTKPSNSKVIKYPSGNKKRILTDFIEYIHENKLTIEDTTNGEIKDPHFSLEGNKNIAKIIYQQVIENYKL
jgi:hypothetical protein